MIKAIKIFSIIFFVVFLLFPAAAARAQIAIELADVKIAVSAEGGNGLFNFTLEHAYHYPSFSYAVETENSLGEASETIFYPEGPYYFLTYEIPAGWELVSHYCEANDPNSQFIYDTLGIKLFIENFSDITCFFNYKKIEPKKNPVIIVPGIMGSYLNKNEPGQPEVWMNLEKMALPGDDSYLYDLAMNSAGWPDGNLLPTDIIRNVLNRNIFQGLISELIDNGYEENKDLFVFPYDWRYFIEWSAGEGDPFPLVKSLKEKVDEIKAQSGAEKVDIIAHSMGGLVAKYYLRQYGESSVDKFIDIATPHFGAPEAFKILMYGDNMGIEKLGLSILNPNTIKNISQNIPSVYELLPSINYFNNSTQDYIYYIYDMHDLDENAVKGRLNYSQSLEFMKNTGRNSWLLDKSADLHNYLDNYSPAGKGVKTYNIVGCGEPTLGQVFVLNKEKSGGNEYGLKYISGDGTVPLRSAEGMISDKILYASGASHPYLPGADGVKQLVGAMLKGEESNFNFSEFPEAREDKLNCALRGTQISFHSPISLHVYDENNNHLGPNENGDIEMGINGAKYDDLEGNKFAFLPKGHNYRIAGEAAETGEFNARIQDINNNEYGRLIYFNEIPLVAAGAKIEFQIQDSQNNYNISIDQDGDGNFEKVINPSSVLNKEEAEDLEKPATEIIVSGEEKSDNIFISPVSIILTAADNSGGSGLLKIEYSLDNGLSWNIYSAPIIMSEKKSHVVLYKATDRAGNIEEIRKYEFKIIATPDSAINDIKAAYENGNIKKLIIKNWLVCQLELIKRLDDRLKKIEISEKIIKKQYELILKQLDLYYRVKWINNNGYDVIKEDIYI
jgi:pimeloyl-ACP methyl ester carboxylesterase